MSSDRFDMKALIRQHVTEKKLFWYVLIVGLVLDIWSKVWAENAFKPEGWIVGDPTPTHAFIEGVLAWKWAGNLGAAFSMFSGQVVMLAVVGIFALGVVFFFVSQCPANDRTQLVSLGLIGSGAFGNIYDRIRFGWVRDFIYFDFDLPFYESVSFIPRRYPVFNVADIAILFGVITLVAVQWRLAKEEQAAKSAEV